MAVLSLRGTALGSAGRPAPIHAVLFDKDGTISKSEPKLLALATARIRHCLSLVEEGAEDLPNLLHKAYGVDADGHLDPAGITAVAARDHNLISTAVALSLVGHGWPEALALAEETFRLADLDTPGGSAGTPPTDGFLDLLMALRQSGVHCAVISNDDRAGIQTFIEHHGLRQEFAAIWSAEDSPRKPDPGAIHQLCQGLGVGPEHCALIGDANSDLRMARSAGVAVVLGYGGGWRRPVDLEEEFPLVNHWRELGVAVDGKPA
jgi:phosphoglycolate phosphatase